MRILAVDDDVVALELLRECLKGAEHELLRCETSPIVALREIRTSAMPYDCILLDIEMPEMTGTALCAEIRKLEHYQNTPILMITQKRGKSAVEDAFANGATDFITKPFEFLEVQTRIRVAERLVNERQAALDSYLAVNSLAAADSKAKQDQKVRRLYSVSNEEHLERACKNMLNLSVFQNYLERIVCTGPVSIDLVAIKVRRIHEIFAKSPALEFVGFLENLSESITLHFRDRKTFLAHSGNGVFLVAFEHDPDFSAEVTRGSIHSNLNHVELPKVLNDEVPLDIVVGSSLCLPEASNLNFRRAVKVAMARMEKNEQLLSEPSSLVS